MQYRVAPGDTLGALSSRFRTTVPAIMKANVGRIANPNLIYVGQLIQIPAAAAQARGGAAAVARPKPAAPATGGESGLELQVLQLVNRERTSRGLRPLAFDARLDRAAENHNAHMARVGVMAHEGIGDGTVGSRVRGAGWTGRGYTENIAYGFGTAQAVMNVWMNSPAHRAGILRPDFTHMAVGHGISPRNGLPYWTQVFGAK